MRYKIWIALIVCGTLVVLAPPLSDYLTNYRISQLLMDRKDFNSVSFGLSPMSSQYRFGCWALGGAMIAIGTLGGWREDAGHPDDRL